MSEELGAVTALTAQEPLLIPRISVPRIVNGFFVAREVDSLLGACQPVELVVSRSKDAARFRPTLVRTAFVATDLWVYAELVDADIGNRARTLNESTCELGDVFEMFFHPEGQDTYTELHVTPENQRMQVRFPSADALHKSENYGQFKNWLQWDEVFTSWTHVETERWYILARVPLARLCDNEAVLSGLLSGRGEMLFSYCRYDFSPGLPPVLSSTSRHEELSFHRLHEWRSLRLQV